MKYILDEKEYQILLDRADKNDTITRDLIQELCTIIARDTVISCKWDTTDTAHHHGCIRLSGDDQRDYCDFCVVQDKCPYKHKRWSK